MSNDKPKRKRGRPKKEVEGIALTLKLAQHHYEYLRFLAVVKKRYATSAVEAAEYILTRELDILEKTMPVEPPAPAAVLSAKNERADALRRLIATYRRYFVRGADTELARKYQSEIAKAESELAEIEKTGAKSE